MYHHVYTMYIPIVYPSCCGQGQQSPTLPCAKNVSTNRVRQGGFPYALTAKKGEVQTERFVVTYVHVGIVEGVDCCLVSPWACTPHCRYYQYLVHCWKIASEDCECRKSKCFKRHIGE